MPRALRADNPTTMTLSLLKAAGDVNRLRILRLVDRAELSVGDLAEITGLSQPAVSRHLATLRATGIVVERHEGPKTLSRLATELPQPAGQLVELIRATYAAEDFGFESDLEALEAHRQRRKADRAAHFDALAGNWDALRASLLGHSLEVGETCGLLLPSGGRWVDVGTGTGILLPWLSALAGPTGKVLAVEAAPRMLDAARARVSQASLDNVELRPGDMSSLPLPDAWADGLVFSLSLGHAGDIDAALAEAARVLRPAGRLAIADVIAHAHGALTEALGPGFRGFDPEGLAARLRAAGFVGIRRLVSPDDAGDMEPAGNGRSGMPRLQPLRIVASRAPANARA